MKTFKNTLVSRCGESFWSIVHLCPPALQLSYYMTASSLISVSSVRWGLALLSWFFIKFCFHSSPEKPSTCPACMCLHRSFSFIVANSPFLKSVACVCDTDHTGVFGSLAHLHCFRPGIQHCSHLPLKHKKLMLTYKHACLAKMLVFIVLLLSDVAALCSHRRSLNQCCVFCLILHDGGAAALLPVMSGRLRCYC